jgi:hypothetical protein
MSGSRRDIFIRCAEQDLPWARWIGWQLEEAGLRVTLQRSGDRFGEPFTADTTDGVAGTEHMLLVASAASGALPRTRAEWAATWPGDSGTVAARVVRARVDGVEFEDAPGYAGVDLVGRDEFTARAALLGGVGEVIGTGPGRWPRPPVPAGERAVSTRPPFPGLAAVPSGATSSPWSVWAMPAVAPPSVPGQVQAPPSSGTDPAPLAGSWPPPSPPPQAPPVPGPPPGKGRRGVLAALAVVAAAAVAVALFAAYGSGGFMRASATTAGPVGPAVGDWGYQASDQENSVYETGDLKVTATGYQLTIDDFTNDEGVEDGVRTVCAGKVAASGGQITLTTTSSEQEPIGEAPAVSAACPDEFHVTAISGNELDLADPAGDTLRFIRK